ncbi:MAG: hydroxymethylbilane synthase [Gammaproteobacteria bacterium]|nr:hydroxymethylbilane synthase [Gammaproteobacteria bacterium]
MDVLRIATRKSPLAMWQAHHVRDTLLSLYPDLTVELVGMTTEGDRILDQPLADIGGKGLFIKELEHALYEDRADIAVHSMKDVPAELPDGLTIAVYMRREDPRDAWVSDRYPAFADVEAGASIGTSSLRRRGQLLAMRSDITVTDMRGNVGTRLKKLRAGDCDGLILAAAGLKRLGMAELIGDVFEADAMIPAVGQGIMGIECRGDRDDLVEMLAPLNDDVSARCIRAERAMSHRLECDCHAPVAGHARQTGDTMTLTGLVAMADGTRVLTDTASGPAGAPEQLGRDLAGLLLDQGAAGLIKP